MLAKMKSNWPCNYCSIYCVVSSSSQWRCVYTSSRTSD